MSAAKPRPRTAKGHRPYVTGEPHAERVLAIAMAVAADVAALHERVDTLARLAGTGTSFTIHDLDSYAPTAEVTAERDAWRQQYLSRLLRIMHEMLPDQGDEGYRAFIGEISTPAETVAQPSK